MSKGCFDVQPLRGDKDIDFAVYIGIEEKDIPIEQKKLRSDVEDTLIVLRGLFKEDKDKDSFDKYFEHLLSLAEAGLKYNDVSPITANEGLVKLKQEIVIQEAGKVKNKYLKSLGKSALCFISFFLLVVIFLHFYKIQDSNNVTVNLVWQNFFIMLSGTVVGVWLSFGIRKVELKFEELHIIEEDRFEPTMRIMFVSLLALIVGLLFSTQAIVIKIGAISTDMLNYDSKIALLLGLFLGLGEKILATKVTEQANRIFKI